MVQEPIGKLDRERMTKLHDIGLKLEEAKSTSKMMYLAEAGQKMEQNLKLVTQDRDNWKAIALSYVRELDNLKKHLSRYHDLPDMMCEGCKWER